MKSGGRLMGKASKSRDVRINARYAVTIYSRAYVVLVKTLCNLTLMSQV